jgi:magnesium transporter
MLKGYFYDANGRDKELDVAGRLPRLSSTTLLWIDVFAPTPDDVQWLENQLKLPTQFTKELAGTPERATIRTFDKLIYVGVFTPVLSESLLREPEFTSIQMIIGQHWLVSCHSGTAQFMDAFRDQDVGETRIGALTADVLAAALLGWHLESFMDAVDRFESHADDLDAKSIVENVNKKTFITQILRARRSLMTVKHKLNDQRSIFHGLSRADLELLTAEQGREHFKRLEDNYLQTADALNRARDWTADSFDLHESMLNQATNKLIRKLTFFSILLGIIGAVAAIFGMNFETRFSAEGETGFWVVIAALLIGAILSIVAARQRKWI